MTEEILGQFLGDEAFPVTWESDVEKDFFWVYDDLHCPHPVSPMFFDIGGWWLSCDHMFRRFGTPFAVDWLAKNVNGYVYTTAIPADPALRIEGTEYSSRYQARVPRDASFAANMGAYLDTVLPVYGEQFADWWYDRLVPEMQRNFAYLEGELDRADAMTLAETAVLLEDAIDMHDRHWKIHWMLNFAQLSATLNLRAVMEKHRGAVDEQLLGRLQNSASDRNWDSIEALWRMKNEVRDDEELRTAFAADDVPQIVGDLRATERGRRFISERVEPYQREYGWHAVWSHEFIFPTVREQMEPAIELVRGYLQTDYDFPTAIEAMRLDIEAASRGDPRGADRRRPRGDARGERRQPADGAPDAGPSLLHRPGGERARPTGPHGSRPEAGRRRPARPAGRRDVPALLRAADPHRERQRARRPVDRRDPSPGARGRRPTAPARLGRHGHPVAARVPVPRQLGLPGPVLPDAVGRRAVDHRHRRVARRDRGDRPGRSHGRRVRRGPRRRHPGLPDDEPGLGRAVHQDRGPRDRHGRHHLAPGRAGARIRHPGRDRDLGGDPADRHWGPT